MKIEQKTTISAEITDPIPAKDTKQELITDVDSAKKAEENEDYKLDGTIHAQMVKKLNALILLYTGKVSEYEDDL